MFSPEEQQLEICLLKSNLEEIENDLVVQRSALPALDAENEVKYRETMTALKIVRSLNSEAERLKQENVRLTAKRMQLKRLCEDINRALERARGNRSDLGNLLKQEEHDTEQEIRKYEDLLREISDRFRKTRVFYNENDIRREVESLMKSNVELRCVEERRQSAVIELKRELDAMHASVPEDILTILGKAELDEELKTVSMKSDALYEKRDSALNRRNST